MRVTLSHKDGWIQSDKENGESYIPQNYERHKHGDTTTWGKAAGMEKWGAGEPTGSIMEGLWGNAMQYCLVPLIIGSLVLKIVLKFLKIQILSDFINTRVFIYKNLAQVRLFYVSPILPMDKCHHEFGFGPFCLRFFTLTTHPPITQQIYPGVSPSEQDSGLYYTAGSNRQKYLWGVFLNQ